MILDSARVLFVKSDVPFYSRGRIQDIYSWPPWPLLFHYYFMCVYVLLRSVT